jgi:hypothetical protein
MAQLLISLVAHIHFDMRRSVLQVHVQGINKPVVFNCPVCPFKLNEFSKGSVILFTCPNCDFKILTTKELFPKCFRKGLFNLMIVKPFLCPDCVDTWLKHVIIPEFKAVVEFLGGKLSPEFKVICDRKRGRGSISNIAYVEFEKGRRALKLLAICEAHIVPLMIDKKKRIEVLTHEALHSLHQKHTRKFREVEKRAIREVQSSIDKICVKWYNTDSFLN